MSLQTDIIIVKALRADAALMAELDAGDVYNTSITLPDAEAENAEVPYLIVSFDGMNEEGGTKDSSYEPEGDVVNVGIEIAAKTRAQLAELAIRARRAVVTYLKSVGEGDEDYPLLPRSISFSAQKVQYDAMKPCFWQQLNINCITDID